MAYAKGAKHHKAEVPDNIVEKVVSLMIEKRMRAYTIRAILAEEGYKVSLQTLSHWKRRRYRTDKSEWDAFFEQYNKPHW